MQHLVESRELGARHGTMNIWRPEERGSKCALQSHAQ